jgi:hypothetical protein
VDLFENLFADRLSGMTRGIGREACRPEKDDSGQMLCRIVPEQVTNPVETGSRESFSPSMRLFIPRSRVDLSGDPPRPASLRGTIGQTSIPGKVDPKETPGIQFLLRDRRVEASEDFQNASLGLFREITASQPFGRHEIETAGSATREPQRLEPGAMNAEKPESARQAEAWKLPEILGGRCERAQEGSRLEIELAGAPLRRRQDLGRVLPSPQPGNGSLSRQEILGADEPGGNGVGSLDDVREDLEDLRDLGIGLAVGAELESRIEIASAKTRKDEKTAFPREIADVPRIEALLGLAGLQERTQNLVPGGLRHGQRGRPPSQIPWIPELGSILGERAILDRLFQRFLESFGGGVGACHGISVIRP